MSYKVIIAYKCGCSVGPGRRREFTSYCGKHGDKIANVYPIHRALMDEKERKLEDMRTRWRRWLGNKTRVDREDWVTLLESNWSGWADRVLGGRDDFRMPNFFTAGRDEVKEVWQKAIDVAEWGDLRKLDNLYAGRKLRIL